MKPNYTGNPYADYTIEYPNRLRFGSPSQLKLLSGGRYLVLYKDKEQNFSCTHKIFDAILENWLL
jgi:hypothetical protein